MKNSLSYFFKPQSVAVIGASSNPAKLSFGILKNLSQYGYQGKIYPINPKTAEILGHRSFASINEVPGKVDLAVIILPAAVIAGVLRDCGEKGVKACIIISGGFKELGKEGKKREEELLKIAQEYGMRIIGPNCVGNVNLFTGLNTTFIKGLPVKGGIGFVSQSGAVCGGVVDHILDEEIGFSHIISLGNEMDVTETDMISYLADDPKTKVIAVYAESIRDGERFLKVAKETSKKKPIVLLKAGRSESGAKAVSSHTGSLAGSHTAYSTAFKQSGVIEVFSLKSLLYTSMAFDLQPLPQNNQAVLFTNAGGPAALLSDNLDAHGLVLADLDQKTQDELKLKLNPAAQTMNPVDMLGGANEDEYGFAIETVSKRSTAGIMLPILVPQALVDPIAVAEAYIQQAKQSGKTTLVTLVGSQSTGKAKRLLHQNQIPVFDYPEDVGSVLGAMLSYREFLNSSVAEDTKISGMNFAKTTEYFQQFSNKREFSEAETRPILGHYGISTVEGKACIGVQEVVKAADKIGYPVVIKVISEDILHKSDSGGIRLNIKDEQELQSAYKEMMSEVAKNKPNAKIDGVLVEKMFTLGEEVIVGMKRDANFGPMLMFGLGGIYVEAIKDVSFRIAPVPQDEIKDMIMETAAGKILTGLRGVDYDIEAVVDVIQRLGQLSLDFPNIQEIEINPLKVLSDDGGAFALDARMIIG